MAELTLVDIVNAVIEAGFPVAIAIYLLIYQARQLENFRMTLLRVKIGLYLILDKMDLRDQYEKATSAYRKEEKDG